MGGGVDTTEGVGLRKADSEKPTDRARRKGRFLQQRGDERQRDLESGTVSAGKERPYCALPPQDRESQKSSSPRGGEDSDPLPPVLPVLRAPASRSWRLAGSPARTGQAGGRGLEGGGPHSLRFLLPSSPRGGHPGYLSG